MDAIQTTAVMLHEPRGTIEVKQVSVPAPGPGEALVRMEACGICHSDLFVAGLPQLPLLPLILGHEGIGRVEAVGEGVTGLAPGNRVGITFLAATCGQCDLCHSNRERFCPRQLNSGYTIHGALAGYAVVPAQHLARISDGLSAAEAAPLCCAGWTAYGALREAGLEPGRTVALFGMGGLGHLAVQYARDMGLKVAAVDIAEQKLALARQLGAEIAVPAENAGRALQKEYGGMDAAVVLTPSPAAIQQAFRSLKRTGTLVLVGLSSHSYELPIVDTVLKGITVRGSYLGTRGDLEQVFRLAESGAVKTHVETHDLAETPRLFEKLRGGELLGRAVIAFC
jgi:propanol-preferring alcohol dehydrogenase